MNNDNNSDRPKRLSKQLSYIEQSLRMISTPQEAPVTIYPGPKSSLINLSKADLEIAERLEKLKRRSSKDIPSEEEMAVRLAQLKGLPEDHYTKSNSFKAPDRRTQFEKADDLFSQVAEEVSLEAKCTSPEDDIEGRLARLRTSNPKKLESPTSDPSSSSLNNKEIDIEEIIRLAADEEKKAKKEIKSLDADTELAAAIAEVCSEIKTSKKQKQKKNREDEELVSNSSDDSDNNDSSRDLNAQDKQEVDRIVEMYTEKARLKKERKKRRKLERSDKKGNLESSSSSSSLSSDLTSESEKLSDD